MLYREITAVCSEIHTEYINTLCGQNVEFANVKSSSSYICHGVGPLVDSFPVKSGGTYSDHWALNNYNYGYI